MDVTRTLRVALIAGALVGAGRPSRGAWRAASTPEGTGPPRAVNAVPPPDRRPDSSPTCDKIFLGLIADGTIEVTAHGAFKRRVQMSIENREDYEVSFVIPIGTFFDAGGTVFQSMIATYDHRVYLGPHDAWAERIRAACENLGPREPRPYDTFQGIRGLHDARLAAVLQSLDKHGASRYARQAAIWIMTSDACWAGFGTRPSGETRVRYVNEDDTAMALWSLDQNGVDITSKAIWADARGILAGMGNPDLKAWLEAKC